MNRSENHFLLLLLLLFAASGCSALIYEIVWYQLLQLAIGSTAVSLGVLLATFMGGLCLGSIGLPRLRLQGRHPLRIYAALEAGIALFGLLVLAALPSIDRVYVAGAEHGLPGMLLRGFICAICLLPPTVLMGASLPALVRWIQATPRGVPWWGLLYGGNTLGAVFGCLLAGFYLLRIHNMATGTYVAAAINLAVAAVSLALAARTPAVQPSETAVYQPVEAASRWPVYLTIALSGATALGAEVVWTRLLGMLLLATVYVFSIILAVFLFGLAIGSAAGSALLRRITSASRAGLVPDPAGDRHGLDRVVDYPRAPVLE
jgi:spermidine synthase